MTKTTEKKTTEAGRPSAIPPQEQMQTAYQVHTLAQMLYGQMAGPQPWVTPPAMQAGFHSVSPHFSPHLSPALSPMSIPQMGTPGWAPAWGASPWGMPQVQVMNPFMTPEFGPFPR